MDGVVIRRAAAGETRPLRQAVLRPHQGVDEVGLRGDDHPLTAHFVAERGGVVVGTVSVTPERAPWAAGTGVPWSGGAPPAAAGPDAMWRLRGMATTPEVRGSGIARELFRSVVGYVAERGGGLLWCAARLGAVGFYRRQGMETVGDEWDEPVIGRHVAMWRTVEAAEKAETARP